MMLSELYGRIGQQLQEYGDAPLVRRPLPNEPFKTTDPLRKTKVEFVLHRIVNDKGVELDKKYMLEFDRITI